MDNHKSGPLQVTRSGPRLRNLINAITACLFTYQRYRIAYNLGKRGSDVLVGKATPGSIFGETWNLESGVWTALTCLPTTVLGIPARYGVAKQVLAVG